MLFIDAWKRSEVLMCPLSGIKQTQRIGGSNGSINQAHIEPLRIEPCHRNAIPSLADLPLLRLQLELQAALLNSEHIGTSRAGKGNQFLVGRPLSREETLITVEGLQVLSVHPNEIE